MTATRPPGSPGITETADTAQVDAIAVAPRSVWVAAGGLVLRLDPATRRTVVVPDIETGQPPVVQVTVGAGAVWATTTAGRQPLRIDPRTARVTASLPVPAEASGVWAVCCGAGGAGGRLTRVDPGGRVVKAIRLPGHPQAVGIGPSGVWVRGAEGPIWRVDPASNRVVATIRPACWAHWIDERQRARRRAAATRCGQQRGSGVARTGRPGGPDRVHVSHRD